MIKESFIKQYAFTPEDKLALTYTEALERLLGRRPAGKSVIDAYLNLLILPCGTLHLHTLYTLQKESLMRLGYKDNYCSSKTLRQRLTWHDVVIWLILIELTDKTGYNPTSEELKVLKQIYTECTKDEPERFKVLYGLMYICGGDEKYT